MNAPQMPNILIVDDEPKNIYAIKRLIEPMNIGIFEAYSGQEALRQVLKNDFFLVIMDVQMPEMDGFETATLIRGRKETADLPIIFATAISKSEDFALQGYESGAVDYIYKPFNPQVLTSKILIFRKIWLQQNELHTKNSELAELNEKLFEKSQELAESNQQLKDFAHVASHDIKTPLALILSFTKRVLKKDNGTLSDMAKDCLNRSIQSGARLIQLIDSLLTFAEAGSNSYELVEVELNAVVHDVLADFHERIEQTKAKVTVTELPKVQGVQDLLYQVFLNLISNSLKYQPQGASPKIDITTHFGQLSDNRPCVEIHVQDNGIGFDESLKDIMFKPFSRLQTDGNYEGSGIGLGTTARIIKQHKGEITATSKVGEGACFTLRLPLAAVELEQPKFIDVK